MAATTQQALFAPWIARRKVSSSPVWSLLTQLEDAFNIFLFKGIVSAEEFNEFTDHLMKMSDPQMMDILADALALQGQYENFYAVKRFLPPPVQALKRKELDNSLDNFIETTVEKGVVDRAFIQKGLDICNRCWDSFKGDQSVAAVTLNLVAGMRKARELFLSQSK